jgi:hypothetical protein
MHFWQSIEIAFCKCKIDGMYYEETDKKADQKTYKMITKLLHEHEGELHKEEIGYITNFTFTERQHYLYLPLLSRSIYLILI